MYYETTECNTCHEIKDIAQGAGRFNSTCASCEASAAQLARMDHFSALDNLSLEERLRKVEEWQYNFHHRHVPAPRF